MAAGLKIHGLKELRRELRVMADDDTWKPELRGAGLSAATVVAEEARSSARRGATTLGGTHASMGSAATASIRPLAQQMKAFVAGGGARIPYYGGWEFGSGGRFRQFPHVTRPSYNLYPAIERKRDEVLSIYAREISGLVDRHFTD